MFPELEHIDQLLPSVEGRSDFVVKRTPRYTAIDYVYVGKDTFDDPLRLECRGIKFYPDGRLMARPFHKFFNVGERPETQPERIDVTRPHIVMDKLDGSMIHPALIDGELVFMTRMGETDIAKRALAYIEARSPSTLRLCRQAILNGLTPIFEYTAPDNRIVVPYIDTKLTLLAMRDNHRGRYLDLTEFACIPVVQHHGEVEYLNSFLDKARSLKNAEGYVLRFADGLMLKIKADDYVLRHRAKDQIGLEKNALWTVLSGAHDDLMAMLPEEDARVLGRYAGDVGNIVSEHTMLVHDALSAGRGKTRKEFATEIVTRLPLFAKAAAFMALDGRDPHDAVAEVLMKQVSTGPKAEALRKQLGLPDWSTYYHNVEGEE